MQIFIPTYGRSQRQVTYTNLPPTVQKRTTLVVQHREMNLYPGYKIAVLPPAIQTIAETRQWIVFKHFPKVATSEKLLMLDDDLVFATRRKDDPNKFVDAAPADIQTMIRSIEHHLDEYALVGVLGREGANRNHEDLVCARMMRVLGYYVPTLVKNKISFTRQGATFTMEDFDVTLQLLRAGYSNRVLAAWCQNQGSSNDSGGCSAYRTLEVHNHNAELLAKAHPEFVKPVQKTTKTAWGGVTRTDVQVQWKKAYLSSGKTL